MVDAPLEVGVIPAAGRSRRLSRLPSPRWMPKALLPVVGRVLIEFPLDSLRSLGVKQVYIIVGPESGFRCVRHYLGDGSDWGMRFKYLVQRERRGLADAVCVARPHLKRRFAVALADDVTLNASLSEGLDRFLASDAHALEYSIQESDTDALAEGCVLEANRSGQITSITEKPREASSGLRGIGIYLFTSRIFDHIAQTPRSTVTGQVELTEAIRHAAAEGRALTYPITGLNINVNTPRDFARACRALIAQLP